MSIEAAIYYKLTNASAITNVVSTRIYPIELPQNVVYPAVTYQRVSTVRNNALDIPLGVTTIRLQTDCYGISLSTAQQIADLIREELNGFNGTVQTIKIYSIFADDERHFFEENLEQKRVMVDYLITFSED